MPNYEVTYVLRPLEEANLTANNERINGIIANAGGQIVARNDWGRRRLAYPIRKITDGYYTTLFATLPGAAVRNVERLFQLNDDVLRYLVVRVDEFRLPTPSVADQHPGTVEVPGTTPPSAVAATEPAAPATASAPAAEAAAPAENAAVAEQTAPAAPATTEQPAAEANNEGAPATTAEGS